MFIGYDSWVEQYFKDVESPDDTIICCNDTSAWKMYPDHNWVYNKLELCKSQNIEAGPHGVKPSFEPVFSKPIINLYGKNRYALKIFNWTNDEYSPGHFWMPVLTGTHLSTDMVLVDGVGQWFYTMQVFKDEDDNITRYEECNEDFSDLVDKAKLWALTNLKGYTGLVNIETIHGKIIDCHLRMTPRFIDLYNKNWLDSVAILHSKGHWSYKFGTTRGYSYTLRATEEGKYIISDKEKLLNLKKEVSSIQIIFNENEVIPLNGRLMIVNGHDATKVNETINELSDIIVLTNE